MKKFKKYKDRGDYHWNALSESPRKLDLVTRTRYENIFNSCNNHIKSKILDFGCGDGALIEYIKRRWNCATITGYEPNDEGFNIAKNKFKNSSNIKILHKIKKIKKGYFDIIICSEVIEHVQNPRQLVKKIYEISGKKTVVIFTTPVKIYESPLDDEHVQEFLPSEFAKILKPFKIIETKKFVPYFALQLYNWTPIIFFKKGFLRIIFNLLYLFFNKNLFMSSFQKDNLFFFQLIKCSR